MKAFSKVIRRKVSVVLEIVSSVFVFCPFSSVFRVSNNYLRYNFFLFFFCEFVIGEKKNEFEVFVASTNMRVNFRKTKKNDESGKLKIVFENAK